MNELMKIEEVQRSRVERIPCAILVDTSSSMDGEPISEVNEGLQFLETDLKEHPKARKQVQICLITFGGSVQLIQDFHDVMNSTFPILHCEGLTPMGQAINLALDKLAEQKQLYDDNGIARQRAWLFLITDGGPNDSGWESAAARLRNEIEQKSIIPYIIGTKDADFDTLNLFVSGDFTPYRLRERRFAALFKFISASMKRASEHRAGDRMQQPPKDDWIDL